MNERQSVHTKKYLQFFVAILLAFSVLFTITACKTTAVNYTVTFNYDGIDNATAQHGQKVTPPTAPQNFGYIFTGWYKDENLINEWIFEKNTVTTEITLYAGWKVDKQLLESSKVQLQNDLQEILLSLDENDYNSQNWQRLNAIVNSAITILNNIIKVEDLQQIDIQQIKQECDNVETLAEALFLAKNQINIALEELFNTYDKCNYSIDNWDDINSIFRNAFDLLNEATDISTVNQIDINSIKDICDEIPNLITQLNSAKSHKISALNALIAGEQPRYLKHEYSSDNWQEILTIIQNTKQAINNATNLDELQNICIQCVKSNCDKVPTIAFINKQANFLNTLNALVNEQNKDNYTPYYWQDVNNIITSACQEINKLTTMAQLDNFDIDTIIENCKSKQLANQLIAVNNYITTEVYNNEEELQIDINREYILFSNEFTLPNESYEILINYIPWMVNDFYQINLSNDRLIELDIFIYNEQENELYISGTFINLNAEDYSESGIFIIAIDDDNEYKLRYLSEIIELNYDISVIGENVSINQDKTKILVSASDQKVKLDITNNNGENLITANQFIYTTKIENEAEFTFTLIKGDEINNSNIFILPFDFMSTNNIHFTYIVHIIGVGCVTIEFELEFNIYG